MCVEALKGRKHSALHQKQRVINRQETVGGLFYVSVWLNKNRPVCAPWCRFRTWEHLHVALLRLHHRDLGLHYALGVIR